MPMESPHKDSETSVYVCMYVCVCVCVHVVFIYWWGFKPEYTDSWGLVTVGT